jgi:hypothetical protein
MAATLDIDIAFSRACRVVQMPWGASSTAGGCVKLRWADVTIGTVPGPTALAAAHSSNLDPNFVAGAGLTFGLTGDVAIRVSRESLCAGCAVSAGVES